MKHPQLRQFQLLMGCKRKTEVAAILGISRMFLSKIEIGTRRMPVRIAFKIEDLSGGTISARDIVCAE